MEGDPAARRRLFEKIIELLQRDLADQYTAKLKEYEEKAGAKPTIETMFTMQREIDALRQRLEQMGATDSATLVIKLLEKLRKQWQQ
jgi:hypothetical protein